MAISLNGSPKARNLLHKFVQVTRSDTTAAIRGYLPKDAMIVSMFVIGAAASDAGTSAVIGVGNTTGANEYLASYDVKTAATGEGYSAAGGAAVGSAFATRLTVDQPLYVKYTEAGTASTAGGAWTVHISYFIPGPGEGVAD